MTQLVDVIAVGTRSTSSQNHESAVPGLVPFLASLTEPVFEFSEEGHCQYTNPAFEALLGNALNFPPGPERCEHGPGQAPPWIPFHEHDRWSLFVDTHRSGRSNDLGTAPAPFTVRRSDNSYLPCEFTGKRLLSRTGNVLGLVAVVRPIQPQTSFANGDLSEITAELHRISAAVQQLVDGEGSHTYSGGIGPLSNGSGVDTTINLADLHMNSSDSFTERIASLSDRERVILRGLVEGKRTATMARELYLSEHTVRNHLKRIYRKVGVHSLGELRENLVPIANDLLRADRRR